MKPIRTLFFCGHESRYGLSHLAPLLQSEVFDVDCIILASRERWDYFSSKLTGEIIKRSTGDLRGFRQRTHHFEQTANSLKSAEIRYIMDANTNEIVETARNYDLLISAAYPQIFKKNLLEATRLFAINFHPSYLPRCRGAHPVYWTIASGEEYGGVSCHVMTEKLDAGPLIAQRKIPFDSKQITYEQLYSLVVAETPILCREVEEFVRAGKTPSPQIGSPTFFKNDREIHRRVFFQSESPTQISAKIRAGSAFAFDSIGGKIWLRPPVTIDCVPASVTNCVEDHLPSGTIVALGEEEMILRTGDSFLLTHYDRQVKGLKRRTIRKAARLFGLKFVLPGLSVGEVLK